LPLIKQFFSHSGCLARLDLSKVHVRNDIVILDVSFGPWDFLARAAACNSNQQNGEPTQVCSRGERCIFIRTNASLCS
jgi:hypothetical protein